MTAKYMAYVAILASLLMPMIAGSTLAYAQYYGNVGPNGETGANTLEEAIKLARNKVVAAQENPETGSGTPYFSASGVIGATLITSGIFGGISGAFFLKARKGKYAAAGRG